MAQTAGPWRDGDRAALHYSTPPGLTLEDGTIYRFRRADPRFGNRLGSYQHGGLPDVDGWVSPNHPTEACNWANPSCFDDPTYGGNSPALGGWNQEQNRVAVVHHGGRWTYNFVCESQNQPSCTPTWAPAHYLHVYGGKMRLREDDDPGIVGTPTGGLYDEQVLAGIESITYSADDGGGAGLYRLRIRIDGNVVQEEIVDANGGRCQDVNPANSNPFEYAHQRPCRASVTDAASSLDTTHLSEGSHTLGVELQDAARNVTMLVPNRQVTVDNIPPPQVVAGAEPTVTVDGGQPMPGVRARGTRGTWTGDGNTYAYRWQRCAPSGLDCVDIDGADALEYMIDPGDVGKRLRLKVTASNSEGSTVAQSAPTEVVQQPPPDDIDPAPRDDEPTPVGAPSARNEPTPEPVNGTNGSERATLTALAGGRQSLLLRFGGETDVTGKLVNDRGEPITGAVLDVLAAQRRNGSSLQPVGAVTTDAAGRFAWHAATGPSRNVRVAYRARRGDAGFAATADVEVLVRGAARLKVKPGRVKNGRSVSFSGLVRGEAPGRPVLVVLEARVGRKWSPFKRVRTGRGGKFKARYRFRATTRTRTYTFRAIVPRDGEWAYEAGESNRVRVRVRGG